MSRKGHRSQLVGRSAEDTACRYLEAQGLTLITRNYHSLRGEIDLIMRDRENLVFVEVRYRHADNFGSGAESVTRNKQRRIAMCAAHFLQRHPQLAQLPGRFDVVSMEKQGCHFAVNWIPDAFYA